MKKLKPTKPLFDFSVKGYTSIPIDIIDKAEWNYKQEDKRKSLSLVGNFLRNGQVENVIVRQTGDRFEMSNGNHRLGTARKILQLFKDGQIEQFLEEHAIEPHSVELIPDQEWNRPPVYFNTDGELITNLDNPLIKGELYCFNLGSVPLKHAQRIAIETNETVFNTDSRALSNLMQDISSEYGIDSLLGTMPFTETDLIGFKDFSKIDFSEFDESDNRERDKIEDRPDLGTLPGDESDDDQLYIQINISILRSDETSIRDILQNQIVSKFEDVEIQ